MKYMGSKKSMLLNGLGRVLEHELKTATRFVDLFSGSGAVAIHVAVNYPLEVISNDLQEYSAILAGSVIERQSIINSDSIWNKWENDALDIARKYNYPEFDRITQKNVSIYRIWCSQQNELTITKAYGGHYLSPKQSVTLDSLLQAIPQGEPIGKAAKAALIHTASTCVASPGHTAQPFQPTRTLKPFIKLAWDQDVLTITKQNLKTICSMCAMSKGKALIADANAITDQINQTDVVFIDPPYSGVHYSRFYHVFETIARGYCGEVAGAGRYPVPEMRPKSKYSLSGQSDIALDSLLSAISLKGATVILTFPKHKCSNGLSGRKVKNIAKKYFKIDESSVKSSFSTLGGAGIKNNGRKARKRANELILILKPIIDK